VKPNIILLGINHCGSSVAAEMLKRLGWNIPDTGKGFIKRNEIKWAHEANTKFRAGGIIKIDLLKKRIAKLEKPWIIKDPKFVITLDYWHELFNKLPLLIFVERETERLKLSFKKRNQFAKEKVPGEYGYTVKKLNRMAHERYENWEGAKTRIKYDDIRRAVFVFDTKRKDTTNRKFGKSGWK